MCRRARRRAPRGRARWSPSTRAGGGSGRQLLRDCGFRTGAVARRNDSVRLHDPRLAAEEKLAIVMGTEGDGLASSTIASCDYTGRSPRDHEVDSLNVAAASAVAFWELRTKWRD